MRIFCVLAIAFCGLSLFLLSCDKDEDPTPAPSGSCLCSYYDAKAKEQVKDEPWTLREVMEIVKEEEGVDITLSDCNDLARWLEDDETVNVTCR